MTTLIVLFNLKDTASAGDYERWAREVDAPTVGSLSSVERFEVLKASGLFGGGESPYQYVEVIRIRDMVVFGADITSDVMRRVALEFQTFADQPLFLVTDTL